MKQNQIKSVQILNHFNNGKIYEVGKNVLHFKDGKTPLKCKVCEIFETSNNAYYSYLIIVTDTFGNKYIHNELKNASVNVEYF